MGIPIAVLCFIAYGVKALIWGDGELPEIVGAIMGFWMLVSIISVAAIPLSPVAGLMAYTVKRFRGCGNQAEEGKSLWFWE
jgi:hypothetical protein